MNKYTETFVCPDQFYMGKSGLIVLSYHLGQFESSKFWHDFKSVSVLKFEKLGNNGHIHIY